MTAERRHKAVWFAGASLVPSERRRPVEAVMMAAVILVCVVATNALV